MKKKPAAKKPAGASKAAAKKAPKKAPAAKKKPVKAAAKKAPAKASAKKAGKAAAKPVAKAAAPKKVEKKPEPKINPPKKPQLLTPKNNSTLQYSQSELFDTLVGYCGFRSRRDAKEFYQGFTDMLQAALKNGFKVVLPGLGKLQVRKTKPRTGINPMTREPIKIPARKKVAFTANKALKDAVL